MKNFQSIFFTLILFSSTIGFAQTDSIQKSKDLEEVVVQGKRSEFRIEGEKKIYDVSSSIAGLGGTAVDVIRNIPSLDVDINGNVVYRGSSPRIFVNDKPSDLTLDQIPSSDIERIELLSMPSAKYEASSSGGILNVVLKNKAKNGVQGMLNAGIDRLLGYNIGGNITYGVNKWELSFRAFFSNRKTESDQSIERNNYTNNTYTRQITKGKSYANMFPFFFSPGIKYNFDAKTNLALSTRFFLGNFVFDDDSKLENDSTRIGIPAIYREQRLSNNVGKVFFQMYSLDFERKMKTEGSKWMASLRLQQANVARPTDVRFTNEIDKAENTQHTTNDGINQSAMFSTDFTLELNKESKLEFGALGNIRLIEFKSTFARNNIVDISNSSDYINRDLVVGVYTAFSQQIKKISYQIGLRMESSFFNAYIKNKNLNYNIDFPFLLFPSVSLQYELNEQSSLQLLYSYKVDRPNFFQTIPIIDYSNPLLIRQGNPNLKPSFVHLAELNYNISFPKFRKSSLLITLYFKNVNDLITSYFLKETNSEGVEEIINKPFNSGTLYNAGLEITPRLVFTNWLNIIPNLNFLYGNIQQNDGIKNISSDIFSFFVKLNANFELPKNWRLQLTAKYNSSSLVPPNSDGDGGRGGNRIRPDVTVTAQGYIEPVFEMGFGVEKNWNKKYFLSLNVSDIVGTDYKRVITDTKSFYQYSSSITNPYFVQLNFRYIFGQKPQQREQKKSREQQRETGGGDMVF